MAKGLRQIQNLRKLSSKNRESSLIKAFSVLLVLFCFFILSFAQGITSGKTVITGDEMEIRKAGDITISRGRSKAVNGRNTIEADVMTYDKKKDIVDASGKVKLFSKTEEDEPVKAYGDFASYNLREEKGKLWGKKTYVEYFMKNSDKPLMLNAKEIKLDRNLETLSAYKNVEIITSSGTIVSDNAVFKKKASSVVVVKDEKRPVADVYYDGRNGLYEADTMTFYNAADKKKIVMSGQVTGKIEMEDGVEEKKDNKGN
jgi:lipopolysaccharide export system protein LptA